jgi:cell division protein FtsW (lipid II flippase)
MKASMWGAGVPFKYRPIRLAEISLLIIAIIIGVSAYALVGFSVSGSLPPYFWFATAAIFGISLFYHVALTIFAPWSDQVILPCVVALNALGLAMIMRISLAGTRGADLPRSITWSIVGAVASALVLAVVFNHRLLRRFTYISMIVGLTLLLLPMLPGLGRTVNGARIWISVAGYSFQPGEFAKIFLAIFFAGYFVINRDNLALAGPKFLGLQLPRARDLGPIGIVWIVSIGVLIVQNDLGMSLMLFGLFVAMLYLATQRVSWLLIGGVLFSGGAFAAFQLFSHVASRIDSWLNAMNPAVFNRVGGSFQLVSGLFGFANGGLLGTGWGRGFPQLVPLSFSDFIFAALGEELGLTGVIAIMLMFMIIVERGLRTAISVNDGFGKLLTGGLAFLLALQLFTIIGGVTRLLPLTGLTVPFMAQGGSSMVSNWILIGLLLRISSTARLEASSVTP